MSLGKPSVERSSLMLSAKTTFTKYLQNPYRVLPVPGTPDESRFTKDFNAAGIEYTFYYETLGIQCLKLKNYKLMNRRIFRILLSTLKIEKSKYPIRS